MNADNIDTTLDRLRLTAFWITLSGAAFSITVASIGGAMYAAVLTASIVRRPSAFPPFPNIALLTALAVVLILSVLLNHFPAESPQGLLKYFWGFLILYAGTEVLKTRRQWFALAGWIIFCEGLAAISGIGQDFIGRDFVNGGLPVSYTETITRITGPFKHCNDFATFLIPGWLFGCSIAIERLRRRRFISAMACFVFIALIGWALIRTMSRGAMIGAGVGMLVLALTLPYRRWTLGIMSACIAAAWLIPSSISVRLQLLFDSGSLRERFYLIRGALRMVEASPWVGLGPNTYSRFFPVFNPPDLSAPVVMYAHNSFLQIAAETGWLGLAFYAALILALVIKSTGLLLRSDSNSVCIRWIRAAALASVVGLLTNAFFESLLQSTQLRTLFWSLLGLSLAQVWVSEPPAKDLPGNSRSRS